MDKKSKNTLIVSIIALALVLIGVTYAYFSARITGLESASTISLTAGRMGIQYAEGNEEVTFTNIYPREEAWATKTFTLTGWNTTDMNMGYNLGLHIINNTFPDDYLTYDLRLINSTNGTPIATKTGISINGNDDILFGRGFFTNANGDTHSYELKIYFKNSSEDQNDAQGAIFNAKLNVAEYQQKRGVVKSKVMTDYEIDEDACVELLSNGEDSGPNYEMAVSFCVGEEIEFYGETYQLGDGKIDADLIEVGILTATYEYQEVSQLYDGLVFSEGTYTYVYNMGRTISNLEYASISASSAPTVPINGWSVMLTNPQSTAPISEQPYSYINGEPVVSMVGLFQDSYATSIDLSLFDFSTVNDIRGMFINSSATSINLTGLDTSKYTDLSGLFAGIHAVNLDLSTIDMSNVTNMQLMFTGAGVPIVFRNKDLSKIGNGVDYPIGNYRGAFRMVRNVDISGCNLSPNIIIKNLFWVPSYGTTTNANIVMDNITINRTTGDSICNDSGLSSSAISMRNADTSRVTSMNGWFESCAATSVDLIGIDTSNVTDMSEMFRGAIGIKKFDLSSFDTSNVTNMNNMFYYTAYTEGYARTQADADRFNGVSGAFGPGNDQNTWANGTYPFIVKP